MKRRPVCRKVEQWKIYDRIAGSGEYADVDKKFLPSERYDWSLLTEIELFRNAVKGCEKVLDVGCGMGHTSLYIASEVGSIIGIDKSERMTEIAKNRLKRSKLENVTFEVGDAENLRFDGKCFDAVILCGSLATFSDRKNALKEIKRMLKKDGKVACIEENWLYHYNHERMSQEEGSFTLTENDLRYRYVERSAHPHIEIDYRCVIDPNSTLGKKLLSNNELREDKSLETKMTIDEVEPHCSEIEYDEQEKFDGETLNSVFTKNGFKDVVVTGYGVMYDLLKSKGLVERLSSYMKELCKAEAAISESLNPRKTEMLFSTCRL
ncbi:MAG: class I SAM-dependent methyltransferase [Candidatus Bathyarchaeia archaeon]